MPEKNLDLEGRDRVAMTAVRNAHKPLLAALSTLRSLREAERRSGTDLYSTDLDGVETWWRRADESGLLKRAAINPPDGLWDLPESEPGVVIDE